MPLTVNEARASFRLEGRDFEPPATDVAWRFANDSTRRAYWRRVKELAIEAKLRELRRGVDVHGKPLKPVKPASRPDGATGKPLSPHHAASRFQRWLRGTSTDRSCTCFWSHGWRVVAHGHMVGHGHLPVRDVVGLTKSSQRWVADQARLRWRNQHPAGIMPDPQPRPAPRPRPLPAINPAIPAAARPLARKYPQIAEYLVPPNRRRGARP